MKALDCIDELKRQYANTDVDWELILEKGYRLFLGRDSTVIDVGAHAGRHTDVFVDSIGCRRVLVFEPLPHQCAKLTERYRAHPHVEVWSLALGRRAGSAEFVFNHNSPEESGLRERLYNDPEGRRLERIRVAVETLDGLDLDLDRLDYIKIDTEGGEVDILEAARQTLERHRPILSIEYGEAGYGAYGHTRETLYLLLDELRYRAFDPLGNRIASAQDWNDCVDNFYWDFYGVPEERAKEFESLLGDRLRAEIPRSLTR